MNQQDPSIESLYSSLWTFVKHPSQCSKSTLSFGNKLEFMFQILSINLLIQFVIGLGISMLILFLSQQSISISPDKFSSFLESGPFWVVIILGGIVLPFFEEVSFRLPLIYNRYSLGIAGSYIFFLSASTFSSATITKFTTSSLHILLYSLGFGVTLVLITYIPSIQKWLQKAWISYFPWIFYAFAVIFAAMHLGNYTFETTQFILVFPLLVLPQFITAILIGYIRLAFGFFWGFLFHSIWNTALLSLVFFVLSLTDLL